MNLADHLRVTARLGAELDVIDIPWVVVGGMAAFLHGVPRAVPEVQLVVRMPASEATKRVPLLTECLRGKMFVDERRLLEAVLDQSSCPLTDIQTGVVVELLLARDEPLSRALIDRRVNFRVYQTEAVFSVLSAEDTVLAALDEFRRTRRRDKEAWTDAVGVLRAVGSVVDKMYLAKQARMLRLRSELEDALKAASGA